MIELADEKKVLMRSNHVHIGTLLYFFTYNYNKIFIKIIATISSSKITPYFRYSTLFIPNWLNFYEHQLAKNGSISHASVRDGQ